MNGDLKSVCRVCCGATGLGALQLFRVSLHRKMMACADIQVWQNDGLPSQICTRCAAHLHIAFQFKRQCERSDVRLREYRDKHNIVADPPDPPEPPEPPPVVLPTPCNFPGCNSTHDMASEIDDIPNDAFSMQANLPMQTVFDISDSCSNQSFSSLSLDHSFSSQVIGDSISMGERMMTLENLAASNQLENILRNDSPLLETSKHEIPMDFLPDSPDIKEQKVKVQNEINNFEILNCPVCNKVFSSASKLARHSRTHSDEILYRCDICNKGFLHGGNYKVHLRMHNDERPFSCKVCKKKCRQQQDLDKHMRTHTGERPHVCYICQKAFTTSSNLVAHERIHRGEKPYVCSVCQKAFCQSNELTKHVRTHTGEKSHMCPVCDKGFNGSSTLVVHMRIHTGERPYVCTICNKGFTQSSCLAAHSRKHNGDNGFPCLRCPRSFITSQDLRRHAAAHAPTNYPCKVPNCVRVFSRPNDLLRHNKLAHTVQSIVIG